MIHMRWLRLTLLLTLLCSLLLIDTRAAFAAGTLPTAEIDRFVAERMQATKIPGMALAIVQGEQVVHVQSFGSAGKGRAVTAETPFIIGSVSKSFTAMAIMQLVEAGKVDLDAPVQQYIPWFSLADQEHAAAVTVRHLLNQTSGISTGSYFRAKLTPTSTLESLVRQLATVAPTAAVGARFQYSNYNYVALGLIVEMVSGQPYGGYMQEHLFGPLGMGHTFTDPDLAARNGLSSGHQQFFGLPVERSFPVSPAQIPPGYIISSAADMGRYLLAVMQGGGGILSPQGVAEMHRGQAQMGLDGSEYGLGWMRGSIGGVEVVHHPGNLETFQSHIVMAADKSWGFVLMVNSIEGMAGGFGEIVDGVARLMAGQAAPEAALLSTGRILQIVSFLLAAILLWQLWALVRLGAWRGRRTVWSYLRIAGNLALGSLLLLAVPAELGAPWPSLLTFTPDPGYLACGIGVIALLLGIGRLIMVSQRPERKTA